MNRHLPILFSTPMVQAILEGRKTMTRRIMKTQPKKQWAVERFCKMGPGSVNVIDLTEADLEMEDILEDCKYQEGGILWVKELHYRFGIWTEKEGEYTLSGEPKMMFIPTIDEVRYYENPPELQIGKKHNRLSMPTWYKRPSLFMPSAACRLFIEVTDVEVDRVQYITEEDAIAEGVEKDSAGWYKNYLGKDFWGREYKCHSAKESFVELWKSINGEESWELNPYVFAISFKQIPR